MGFGSGGSIQIAAPQKWYAVRVGRQTGVFPTWEQAQQQVGGFPGAQMKEFERSDAAVGSIDRGLLQAKMWMRSGSEAKPSSSSMPPPGPRPVPVLAHQENEPVQNLPSARRFSPMLLDAFHFGFFGSKCAREAAEEQEEEEQGSRRPGRAASAENRRALGLAATEKRKRPRTEDAGEPPGDGDVYARKYQDRTGSRHRSVLLS
jgi:hypothetical protein